MTTKSDDKKLTLTDAATMLAVSQRTIHYAISTGKLEPVRGGISRRAYWVTRASVEKILKGGAQ